MRRPTASRTRALTPESVARDADRVAPWWPSLLAGALGLATCLFLAPRAVGDKDAAEFTLVLARAGVAHPSGYPLYTLLGHPFVVALHALGAGWAYAANAWSALGGGAAILLLHRLATRLAGRTAVPAPAAALAALPVALFGLNPLWTYEASLAETGSWHVAWVAGAGLLCLSLLERLERGAMEPAAARRAALAWGLTCGVGLAHHLTALLVLVPLSVALALACRGAARSPSPSHPALPALAGLAGLAAVAAVLPLASYGIIAWRAFHPGPAQWGVLAPSWDSVWAHVTAAQYRGYFGTFAPSPGQSASLARFAYPLLLAGAAALAVAIATAGRGARRTLLLAMAAACSLQALVVLLYGVPDPGSYFLPVMALSLAAASGALALPAARGRGAALATLVVAGLAVAVPAGSWLKLGVERRALFERHEELLRRMWASVTVERGFVLWHSDVWHALRIWQELEGEKPDLVLANPAMLTHAWPRHQFAAAHGFDPLEGVPPAMLQATGGGAGASELAARIAANINDRSPLPVIIFDMTGPSVRMLQKDGAAPLP